MMKKFLLPLSLTVLLGLAAQAQENPDFDKKFRFGLRAALQPTWYKSGNTASKGDGSNVGFGFGLTMEFKLSNIVHFQTGLGGDFEGGKIAYRNDGSFQVRTVLNNEGDIVEAKNGMKSSDYDLKNGSTLYTLKERKYKTTFVTIPLLLKMMTNEYGGFRYFGVFGGEIGVRAGMKADDVYYSGQVASNLNGVTVVTPVPEADLKKNNIVVGKDGSLVPLRVGMNLGLGTEYRLAGSTSLVISVNYFQAFTNLMRKESKYLSKNMTLDPSNQTYNFNALNQSYLMRAVRINIGIMF